MKKIRDAVGGYFATTDKWLWILWLAASLLSILFLWGITNTWYFYSRQLLLTQGLAVALGALGALVMSLIDYRALVKLWKLYVPVCIVLVLLTFVIGTARGNDQAWLTFSLSGRDFSLQPAELLKIGFIMTFSLHLDKVKDQMNKPLHVLLLCLHGGAYILLIQRQDSGTSLIYVCIFLVMFFCAGIKWRYILAALCSLVAVVPLLWFKIMNEDQKMRILIVLNPQLDSDYAYQQIKGLKALGMGGLQGTGIFNGQHILVPEVYNDFIFSFIGEASGFIGALGVIVLLMIIAYKVLFNSSLALDVTGRMLCVGVFAMLVSQTFINLGMCMSVLPVIGVTLPLLSYGGTSVLSLYLGLGLVLSVYSHSSRSMFYEK